MHLLLTKDTSPIIVESPKMPHSNSVEVNFDGLIGPAHHYGGFSYGNIASLQHRHFISNPRQAALEGLEKMKKVMELGSPQGIFPPQKPRLEFLRQCGFTGKDAIVLEKAYRSSPELVRACYSASSMWAANCAVITPSSDSHDGKVHITPANLASTFHRSLEVSGNETFLRHIFPDPAYFIHHPSLPPALPDEGAANHTRFCMNKKSSGLHFFVNGKSLFENPANQRIGFPARQCREAQEVIVRNHGLSEEHVIYARQHPRAIDAGVFHNDVIAVGNGDFFLFHEYAFENQDKVIRDLQEKAKTLLGSTLSLYPVSSEKLSLEESVQTYLFNSQLITDAKGKMTMICPQECKTYPKAKRIIEDILNEKTPIASVMYVPLSQSMGNGGGPACLRLRVVLTQEEFHHVHPGVLMTDALYQRLKAWIHRHYRERVTIEDFADPYFLSEISAALSELSQILRLPSL